MIKLFKRIGNFYKVCIVLIDLALINFAYVLAFLIIFDMNLPSFNFKPYFEAMPFITIAALVYFDLFGMLKFFRRSYYDILSSLIFVIFILSITTVTITYFMQGFSFPRSVLILAPILQIILLGGWKGIIIHMKKYLTDTSKLMVIGSQRDIDALKRKLEHTLGTYNIEITHIFLPTQRSRILENMEKVDEVFICSNVSDEHKMKIISYCMGCKKVFYIVPQLFEISLFNSRIVQFGDIPVFVVDQIGLSDEQRFFKRVFDIVFSIIAILFTLPVMLLAAIAVKATSSGKAIYKQERLTIKNKAYNIYKIRTMYEDAEKYSGPVISGNNDPRVTKVGRVLRKFRIDEIPQLFNVLMGDMSLVGPRSERPYFVQMFEKEIPGYYHRSAVKAGITGFAQVLGNYDTSAEDKLRYDLLYIRNYSILLDIKLILQTVKVVLTGKNVTQKSFYRNLNVFNKASNL